MSKLKTAILGTIFLLAPLGIAEAASSEVHVTKDGKATMSNVKVMQINGNTFFTRLYWGESFVRLTIKTTAATKMLRATGEVTTLAEMHEGDLLDVTGELASQSDTLTLVASSIKNSSVQKEQAVMSGMVKSIDLPSQQFTLDSKKKGIVVVSIATSTQIFKGTRTLDLEHLRVGNTITKVSGDYDLPTKTLRADTMTIYVDPAFYKPRLFKGRLAEAPIAGDSSSVKVTIDETTFTIALNNKTSILRNNKSTTTLERFLKGDSIRLYGTRREVDEPIIDAEVIRNTNL